MKVEAKDGKAVFGLRSGHLVEVAFGTDVLVAAIKEDRVEAHLPHPTGGFEAAITVLAREDFPGIYG